MTDEQIVKTIAEKIYEMPEGQGWFTRNDLTVYMSDFNPLESDVDCMMAWDKFAEMFVDAVLEHGHGAGGLWLAATDPTDGVGILRTDRRRAMCECMAKAVTQ